MEPSYASKCAGMQYPVKTLPAPASTGYAHPVPLPQPIEAPIYGACPKPAYAQPAAYSPACTSPVAGIKAKTTTGTILVLFILLVIVSRTFPAFGEAKICRK